jgi:Family of unknown function (DUF5317)
VFILYGLIAGLVVGGLFGGRLEGLAEMRLGFGRLAILALLIQVALFSPLADAVGQPVARATYVASTAAVGLVVAANLRIPGLPLIAAGAAANLVAIVANGGAMPASASALAAAGIGIGPHTNSVAVDRPAFEPLTDIFALPAWVPFANVFSVGDVLIGIGLAIVIAAAMRTPKLRRRDGRPPPSL